MTDRETVILLGVNMLVISLMLGALAMGWADNGTFVLAMAAFSMLMGSVAAARLARKMRRKASAK
jgi:hypothetical protein